MPASDTPILTNSRRSFTDISLEMNKNLKMLGAPHLNSFNYMVGEGFADCIQNIRPIEFEISNRDRVKLKIEHFGMTSPSAPLGEVDVKSRRIYPTECRQRMATYKGNSTVKIGWEVNGIPKLSVEQSLGELPIMLKSSLCNLADANPKKLIAKGEHENEWGGYFVVKGHEKIIRMLQMNRRNYPIAVKRTTWKDRGQYFTEFGVVVRCVKSDQTSMNNVLHFLNNGTVKMMFSHRKTLSYIPVLMVLKALTNYTDEHIFLKLINGFDNDQYYINCVQNMLRMLKDEGIHNQIQCLEYIGAVFRSLIKIVPSWAKNIDVAQYILDECILIHLDDNDDKFNLLVFMVQKLFMCAQNKKKIENPDTTMLQELLTGGHLYQKIIKERLELWLQTVRAILVKSVNDETCSLTQTIFTAAVKSAKGIDRPIENFFSTGNLNSPTGLGLMQTSGFVIMAENINRMRYMAHFRSIHRGSYFVEMKTTEARQLLPDAWGFVCPVHTPDGTPCGLLNHLTVDCVLSDSPNKLIVDNIPTILASLGMISVKSVLARDLSKSYTVLLEGCIIGYVHHKDANNIVNKLRTLKISGVKIPLMTEIVLIPDKKCGQYPGLYLFVGPARMMRPVINLSSQQIEYIGTFEQVYMDVCVSTDESYTGITTHKELSKTSFMSNLANLIPMPDCNQSPRNMYQCQMGKQTMGTPCHNWQLQSETKLYRIQTPSTPLFRPVHYDKIELDDFAMGTNAVVAVISYTGYDMEDAMIINKSAYERGFAHGSIYKSKFYELDKDNYFARDPNNHQIRGELDTDGLPHPGTVLSTGSPLYCYFDTSEAVFKTEKYRASETAIVDNVKLCGSFATNPKKMACITLRVQRNPSVGDKFASRAGQKGICSQKWASEDLPFSESGLIPDIVFNPHGFPSRMTIAMMIELMAGKTASVHGLVHDATPFKFSEDDTAIDFFGKLLESGGYNYYGTERLYSGIDGRELKADIFFGIVYYQRLRHMVSDKWQVRSTGPIDAVTHQPVKGRQRGGGVRFGEMERDALIAHGASFLLQERLLRSSDKVTVLVCKECGTFLGPVNKVVKRTVEFRLTQVPATCRICKERADISYIEIPYILKYLVAQLASVNIKVKLDLTHI